MRSPLALASLLALAPFVPAATQQLPPGQIRPRPAEGREPEFPPPDIRTYQPRSTLVVPAHPVPRAKYPAIDGHGHPPALTSPEIIERVVAAMDSLNLRVMISANSSSGERLAQQLAALRSTRHADRFVFFTGLDLRNVGPGSGARIAAQLEADIKAGAVGVGEIGKQFGMGLRKADGSRLQLDDPELDPVWETAARLKIPVFIHVADPSEFWAPLDYHNERWLELALFPGRRYPPDRFPSFEQLMTERNNLFRRHPRTTFVAADLGWHANDLTRLGKLLSEFPNVYTEVGAVLADIGRQPRAAHDFFRTAVLIVPAVVDENAAPQHAAEETAHAVAVVSEGSGAQAVVAVDHQDVFDGVVGAFELEGGATIVRPSPAPTPAATLESTPTPTPTAALESTPTPTPTATPESSPTPTPTATPESTPTPTPTATPESTPTPTPATPTWTASSPLTTTPRSISP